MKNVLKLIGGLLIGIAAGLLIAASGIVLFTDTTFREFAGNLLSTDLLQIFGAALVGVAAFLGAIAILIPAHEAGHLVCGLLTGYKFVSFRIFNLTFIKSNGRFKVKRYSVAGTGGQCLLTPPDLPLEQVPTALYNAGGVLANLLILLAVLPLFSLDLDPFLKEALAIFCLTDAFLILTNGIPMKLGGIGNDAYHMLYLKRAPLSKLSLVNQLRSNALIQEGARPKDMPDSWFRWTTDIDFKNPLEVGLPLMYASRLIDKMDFEEAYQKFDELYSHKSDIIQLYVNEIACELAFCAMVTGRPAIASELFDSKLTRYIEAYRGVMSSKQRILCAKALYLDNNRPEALSIHNTLEHSRDQYLLQGETKSDLAIMRHLLTP